MLLVEHVSRHFGGLRALNGVSLAVPRGIIFALIGPNGSGKTTLFNVITGVFPATEGRLAFDGREITEARTHEVVRRGIGRTFQTIRLFTRLSVFDNVWVALRAAQDRQRGSPRREHERVEELLAFNRLLDKRDELAGNLNFGEQRRLELARALATEPTLLLLDEPAAGMNYAQVQELIEDMRKLRGMGKTIFLIEHVMDFVMGVAHRIAVLNFGEKIAEGTPDEIQGNPPVLEAYLGGGRAGAEGR
ncbi:MAG: ABC transporter ATP-binding protein [Candidatus Rokubacteria bacterium]|nr:ABC transporter ATP-binding protein [Candidatus Rokubacteria bacterium]